MLWRVLPPLVCHHTGLTAKAPLAVPLIGVLVLPSYVAVFLRRRETNARFVFGGTLLVTTTSAVLVPLHWFGMNDAWVWLGLLAVAFGRSSWAIPLACVLCPWIDERFIIGFPLAWCVRCLDPSWTSLQPPRPSRARAAPLCRTPTLAQSQSCGRYRHRWILSHQPRP
jgi:hypothetical protein